MSFWKKSANKAIDTGTGDGRRAMKAEVLRVLENADILTGHPIEDVEIGLALGVFLYWRLGYEELSFSQRKCSALFLSEDCSGVQRVLFHRMVNEGLIDPPVRGDQLEQLIDSQICSSETPMGAANRFGQLLAESYMTTTGDWSLPPVLTGRMPILAGLNLPTFCEAVRDLISEMTERSLADTVLPLHVIPTTGGLSKYREVLVEYFTVPTLKNQEEVARKADLPSAGTGRPILALTEEEMRLEIETTASRLFTLRPEYCRKNSVDNGIVQPGLIFCEVRIQGSSQHNCDLHVGTNFKDKTFGMHVQVASDWSDPFGRLGAANQRLYRATNGVMGVAKWEDGHHRSYPAFAVGCVYGPFGMTDRKILALDRLVRHFVPKLSQFFDERTRTGTVVEEAVHLIERELQAAEIRNTLAEIDAPHRFS